MRSRFTARAAELLRDAGAYLHAADGEGVVAVFGFPGALEDHAEKAVRAAFDLARAFAETSSDSNGQIASGGAHVGVSSGSMITAPTEEKQDIFVLGEPIELARRFCVANRFYGSKILIGPRTFELANNAIVARPIDARILETTRDGLRRVHSAVRVIVRRLASSHPRRAAGASIKSRA